MKVKWVKEGKKGNPTNIHVKTHLSGLLLSGTHHYSVLDSCWEKCKRKTSASVSRTELLQRWKDRGQRGEQTSSGASVFTLHGELCCAVMGHSILIALIYSTKPSREYMAAKINEGPNISVRTIVKD